MTGILAKSLDPQTIAVIDVGSNAIRMIIAQIDHEGAVTKLESLQRMVPLGQDSFQTGHIEPDTINLAIEVLRGFQAIMEPYKVQALRAVATSAVREATNQELFIERVFMATGIAVEVITGSEADRLLYSAVRNAMDKDNLRPMGTSVIVEMGSGTAELAIYRRDNVIFSGSYPLGATRLHSALRIAHRPPQEAVELIRRYVEPSISVIEHSSPLSTARNFMGVGGDMRFVANQIARRDPRRAFIRTISRRAFLQFASTVSRMRPEAIAKEYGLPYQDSEALTPALLTYVELFKRTQARVLHVPFVSMRDGMILDYVAEITGQGLEEIERQIYSSTEMIGQRYHYDEKHARHVADLACSLFDLLQTEHRLGRRERRLLRVAALLHDVGNFISNRSHHKHSEYIIKSSEIFGLRMDDRNLIACIARYHRRGIPKMTHPVFANLGRQERANVSKLAAILRVADALDRSHSRKIGDMKIDIQRNAVIIRLSTHEDLTLESLALRTKGDLFEEVFGRTVLLQN